MGHYKTYGGGGGRGRAKYKKNIRARENYMKKNSCTPINPKKYSCYSLKRIRGQFSKYKPRRGGEAYIWRGDLTEGFLRYRFVGFIFGRAYTWRGLFSEFYGFEREKASLTSG